MVKRQCAPYHVRVHTLQIALFKTGDKGQGQREERNFLDSLQGQALGLGDRVAALISCRKPE